MLSKYYYKPSNFFSHWSFFFFQLELSQGSGLVLPADKEMGKITSHAPTWLWNYAAVWEPPCSLSDKAANLNPSIPHILITLEKISKPGVSIIFQNLHSLWTVSHRCSHSSPIAPWRFLRFSPSILVTTSSLTDLSLKEAPQVSSLQGQLIWFVLHSVPVGCLESEEAGPGI